MSSEQEAYVPESKYKFLEQQYKNLESSFQVEQQRSKHLEEALTKIQKESGFKPAGEIYQAVENVSKQVEEIEREISTRDQRIVSDLVFDIFTQKKIGKAIRSLTVRYKGDAILEVHGNADD